MTRLLSIVFAAVIAGTAVNAQSLVVRSGEHERFTRLVLPLPDNVSWSIKRSNRAVLIKFDRPSIRFDVSRVFDRIPHSRLSALSQKRPGADLVLNLGCLCSVSSFVDTPGFLVVDIRDSEITARPRQRMVRLPTNQGPYRFSLHSNSLRTAPLANQMLMLPTVIGRQPRTEPVAHSVPPTNNPRTRPRGSINISEERLLAQINRASDQGLIELAVVPQQSNPQAPVPDDAAHSKVQAIPATQDVPLPLSLSATTVVDRDLAMVAHSLTQSEASSVCLPSQSVALHNWGGKRSFSAEIGHWRSRLFGEFDRIRPETALSLARAYLHYGFGAEAAQTIGLVSQANEDSRILGALARVIDAGGAYGDSPFADQQHCEGDVALWAFLSAETLANSANDNAILLAFSRLPPQLRGYLGPRISQKFTKHGDSEMANSILRMVARTGTEPGSGIELAEAAVAQARGDPETERRELSKSLASGSEHSPEALIKLVSNAFETRESVSPSTPDLAAAYAREFRNAKIGPELRRTRAVSLALAGQFIAALDTLQDIETRDGTTERQSALIPLISLIGERADDITFLRITLNLAPGVSSLVPAETGNQMARRLLDLGFSNQAADWISTASENSISDYRRRMRAEIALAHHRPHLAMVELLGLGGVEASRLRAAAMLQQGDYQKAGQMLVAARDFDQAARGFWLGDEWEAIPDEADSHYARVVTRSAQLRNSEDDYSQLTPLAEARALMQNSSDVRAEIGALLNSVLDMPEAAE